MKLNYSSRLHSVMLNSNKKHKIVKQSGNSKLKTVKLISKPQSAKQN